MAFNAKQYLADKAAELGLDENEMAVAEKILSNNRFKGDFVPLPDFHSTLDRQKSRYEEQISELTNVNREWKDAYDTEYAPALQQLQRLQSAGFNVSGFKIDEGGDLTTARGKSLSESDIERMIAERLDPVRETTLAWGAFVADKAVEYKETYNKRFDAEAFRKFGYENRQKYPTFDSAYDAYTEADRKAKDQADLEKWKADEREKIRMDLASNMALPEFGSVDGNAPAFNAPVEAQDGTMPDDEARKSFAMKFKDIGPINMGG